MTVTEHEDIFLKDRNVLTSGLDGTPWFHIPSFGSDAGFESNSSDPIWKGRSFWSFLWFRELLAKYSFYTISFWRKEFVRKPGQISSPFSKKCHKSYERIDFAANEDLKTNSLAVILKRPSSQFIKEARRIIVQSLLKFLLLSWEITEQPICP